VDWASEIRAKVNIADVVAEYARLKPSGANKFTCLSPFKQETRPSFSIDAAKNVWYDFSTKQGGDVVKFVMLIENLEFREALEFLGHKYHIPDPGHPKKGEGIRSEGREALFKAYDAAAIFYENLLWNTSHGDDARLYLEKRGVSKDIAKRFRLGATGAGWDAMSQELLKRGARESDLVAGGLAVRRKEGQGVYDAFRNRLIFPITNASGRIVAFGGRALDDNPAKYINSANSPIYNKSMALYGLSQARRAIGASGCVVLVEGYMDVVSLVQAGFENTVATCGTALTETHVQVLFRYTKNIVIAMDGDEAGRNAAVRTAALLIREGALPRIVVFTDSTDPDEFVKREGADALTQLIERAVDPVSFILDNLGAHANAASREQDEWIQAVAPLVRDATRLARDEFTRIIAEKLSVEAQVVNSLVGWQSGSDTRYERDAQDDETSSTRRSKLLRSPRTRIEASVLSGVLRRPELLAIARETLVADDFGNPAARAVFETLAGMPNPRDWDSAILALDGEVEGMGELYGLLIDETLFPSPRDFPERVERLFALRRDDSTSRIEREIVEAEKAGDGERVAKLAGELTALKRKGSG
jgi:DNA primase